MTTQVQNGSETTTVYTTDPDYPLPMALATFHYGPTTGALLGADGRPEIIFSVTAVDALSLGQNFVTTYATVASPEDIIDFAEALIKDANARAIGPTLAAKRAAVSRNPVHAARSYVNLSPLCKKIYTHMDRAGSISAREAMADMGITSASLARRICDIEEEGFKITRKRRAHPMTGREYTRYSLTNTSATSA